MPEDECWKFDVYDKDSIRAIGIICYEEFWETHVLLYLKQKYAYFLANLSTHDLLIGLPLKIWRRSMTLRNSRIFPVQS